MSSQFTLHKTIVLGYGAYEKIKGSFLNKIIRFETLLTAVQYFSWAKADLFILNHLQIYIKDELNELNDAFFQL